jgi:hypothetical protein
MVTENGCGEIVHVANREITKIDFMVASPIPCSSLSSENTPNLQSTTAISGKIIWDASYPHQDFSQYMLNFCPKISGECYGSTIINSDGTFYQALYPDDYRIALNFRTGAQQLLGWYLSTGMVDSNSCSEFITVADGKIINIDFKVGSPVSCESLETQDTPTPQPTMGVSGKIIWDSSYPNLGLDKYMLNFCPIKGGNCRGATPIQSDGTFIQSLPPGYYWVNLNLREDGTQPLGWYSSKGMVKENNCARLVQVTENIIVKIDFEVNSPIPCN